MKKFIGVYDDDVKLMNGIDEMVEKKVKVDDVITPFVIEELFERLNIHSNIQLLAFIYGVLAVIGTFAGLYYTFVIDYPLNIGGKPNLSLTFVILLFVLMVLTVVVLIVMTFFHQERLTPWKKLPFEYPGMHVDKFVVVVPTEEKERAESIFKETGAIDMKIIDVNA